MADRDVDTDGVVYMDAGEAVDARFIAPESGTRIEEIFLSGSIAGRKSVPFGNRVQTRRLIVIPVKRKVQSL